MKILSVIIMLLCFIPMWAQKLAFKVGMKVRSFADESPTDWAGTTARPLLAMICFPAEAEADEKEITVGAPDKPLFISGRAMRDAKILPSRERRSLVVLSHGGGGAALQMMWLGEYLASRVFIVAAANHHCATGAKDRYTAQGFFTVVGARPRFICDD